MENTAAVETVVTTPAADPVVIPALAETVTPAPVVVPAPVPAPVPTKKTTSHKCRACPTIIPSTGKPGRPAVLCPACKKAALEAKLAELSK